MKKTRGEYARFSGLHTIQFFMRIVLFQSDSIQKPRLYINMYLIVTIDVEEDNWGQYDVSNPSLSNLKRLPELQELFDRFGITPTYMITYPVATNREAIFFLRKILDEGRCEIAVQLHPWNTPPFDEEINDRNSMLCNLPRELQYKKIESLHTRIYENFNIEPLSFRSGRWAYDKNVAENIYKLNYKIDSSVTPFTDWSHCHGPDYSGFFPMGYKDFINNPGKIDSYIFEVPATIGFLQSNFNICNRIDNRLNKKEFRNFHLPGILDKLRFVNKIWLSPEVSDGPKMIQLTNSMRKNGYNILNMFFHSTSLVAGLTPFTKNEDEVKELLRNITLFLEFAVKNNFKTIKLLDSVNIL
jgi:hypothetical protein